jgi:predicted acylesterase/phospholipase RssA
MMGLYHFGHILGLIEAGILPHIISGTSAGSIVAAIICTRTDEELKETLTPQVIIKRMTCFRRPWGERIKSLWRNGNMFDFDEWADLIKWFTNGDMTFEEAYHKTGRVFCITLSSTTKKAPPVLLNYLSAPHVTIASAVLASAAVPGFIPPVSLQYKDKKGLVRGYNARANDKGKDQTYFDGSIRQDIPVAGLAEMLNCQFFIACQCNPHVVPFFFNAKGGVGRPSRWSSGAQEHSWRGGFLLAALEMYLKVRLSKTLSDHVKCFSVDDATTLTYVSYFYILWLCFIPVWITCRSI